MNKTGAFSAFLAAIVIAGAIGSAPTLGEPAKVFKGKENTLEDAERKGARIFASDAFGAKQMIGGQPATCASCHLNDGKSEGLLPNGEHIPSLLGAFPAPCKARLRPAIARSWRI
jgi:cytochrome c553